MSDGNQSRYKYTLYSYYRSSCSARIRIAAHLKNIPLEYKYISLVKGEQHDEAYVTVNPSESVPTLIVNDAETGREITRIRQSVAILEFLEETDEGQTKNRLLPSRTDPVARAKVRELVNVVACDIQPVTNLRVLNYIKPLGVEAKTWQQHFMTLGFRAYEELVKGCGGKYSVGDEVSLADCALAPAVDGALRFGVDVPGLFPRVWRVWEEVRKLDAFQKGRWDIQEDTPEELRNKA